MDKLEARIIGNNLYVKYISENNIESNNLYIFRVFLYDVLVEEKTTPYPEINFNLNGEGIYRVEMQTNSKTRKRSYTTIAYFDKNKEKYMDFIKGSDIIANYGCPQYYEYNYPFQDFSVIYNGGGVCDFEECKINGFSVYRIEDYNMYLVSKNQFKNVDNAKILFSGYILDNKLIYGINDISEYIDDLEYMKGCFSACIEGNGNLCVCSDYFGMYPIYYYKDSECIIVSNRYHLLLLCMRDLKIKPKVRLRNVISVLSAFSAWNSYPMSNMTLFENLYILDVGEKIELTPEGNMIITKTGIYEVFCGNNDITEQEYQNLINLAKEEIENNINVLLNSRRFEKYSVDLTGGMDSRIVFAALTNVYRSDCDIKIYTAQNGSNDYFIPLNIIDAFQYDYDFESKFVSGFINAKNCNQTLDDLLECRLSLDLGKSYSPSMIGYVLHNTEKCCKMTGALGEIISRPYVTYSIFGNEILNMDMTADITNEQMEKVHAYLRRNLMVDYESAGKVFENEFVESFNKINWGRSFFEKLEYMYVMRRNRFHFSQTRDGGMGYMLFAPNMSKYGFKAFHSNYGFRKGFEHGLNLIQSINPVVASFDYSSEYYNNMVKMINKKKNVICPRISVKADVSRHDALEKDYYNEHHRTKLSLAYSALDNIKDVDVYLRNMTLCSLKRLMCIDNDELDETIGEPLFFFLVDYFENNRNQYTALRVKSYYAKITNIVAQINIVYGKQKVLLKRE